MANTQNNPQLPEPKCSNCAFWQGGVFTAQCSKLTANLDVDTIAAFKSLIIREHSVSNERIKMTIHTFPDFYCTFHQYSQDTVMVSPPEEPSC